MFIVVKTRSLPCRDKKERRREKQKGQQNGETSPTHNPMQPGENGIENPDFNKEVSLIIKIKALCSSFPSVTIVMIIGPKFFITGVVTSEFPLILLCGASLSPVTSCKIVLSCIKPGYPFLSHSFSFAMTFKHA